MAEPSAGIETLRMDGKESFSLIRFVRRLFGWLAGALAAVLDRFEALLGDAPAPRGAEYLPYKLREDFLSRAELGFFQALQTTVRGEANVCAKVSLGDLFFGESGDTEQNRVLRNRINRKHVDFLLCDPQTMTPLCGVELDDRSHDRADRVERDRFVDQVFEAAGLPLVRVPAARTYAPAPLHALLAPHLGLVAFQPELCSPTADTVVLSRNDGADEGACPRCGGRLLVRTARSGVNAGEQFIGCGNFPKCRFVRRPQMAA